MSEGEAEQGPQSPFHTCMAEGDQLVLRGAFLKALERYSAVRALRYLRLHK